jgi:hypothetical protein
MYKKLLQFYDSIAYVKRTEMLPDRPPTFLDFPPCHYRMNKKVNLLIIRRLQYGYYLIISWPL